MKPVLLVVNAGSSSLKFALYELAGGVEPPVPAWSGELEGIGGRTAFRLRAPDGPEQHEALPAGTGYEAALAQLLGWLGRTGLQPSAAAHRVVHGGQRFDEPVLVDAEVLAVLHEYVPLAPLHQPRALAAIETLARARPGMPQVACFDTSFHHGMPEFETTFALPAALREQGIRRYGFHGLSYEHAAAELQRLGGACAREARTVVAHLGSGASLCAMRGTQSVACTMGFTALDGVPMARRCGALDPGVVLYLQQQGWDAAQISRTLYEESGLLGLSGLSGDVRDLLPSADPQAQFAIDLFCYRIGRELGAMAATLGGLDVLAFTGGIGEHQPAIRARIAQHAAWLGVRLDARANVADEPLLSAPGSKVAVWRIAADEDGVMARHAARLLRGLAA
jgi:acetate kinase